MSEKNIETVCYCSYFVERMKCLICSLYFIRESLLKNHYAAYHFINEEDIFL